MRTRLIKVAMADALTQRQREILDFISASIVERGFPPTLREIGEHFSIRSTNGVNDHLKALEKKGHLRREDLKSRAMRPTQPPQMSTPVSTLPDGADIIPLRRAPLATGNVAIVSTDDDMAEIPILGRVAAGQPILAVEHATDTVRVDRVLIGGHREVFGLRIVGESMIEGEATVKRYYPEGDNIRFQPANCNMSPIIVRRSDFKSVDIIGIVVGIYRKL